MGLESTHKKQVNYLGIKGSALPEEIGPQPIRSLLLKTNQQREKNHQVSSNIHISHVYCKWVQGSGSKDKADTDNAT